MREFFRGWRRKVGCVTLALACIVTSLWVRSLSRADDVFLPFGDQATIQLISQKSTLTVRKFVSRFRVGTAKVGPDRILLLGVFPPTKSSTGNVALSADERNRSQLGTPYAWKFKVCGVGLATYEDHQRPLRVVIFTIPYWSIAIPLTLLSAYLILWKPRKQK
ncbi:MAG TPA: hypothetical protein VGM98_09200 [Schlesneria sp.]|jgi:hypothetical protein